MSLVDAVYDIWYDLENTYETKNEGLSKRDFLLKLIGYNSADRSTKLDSLKAAVLSKYEGNEEKCDVLAKIFDSVSENLTELVNSEIENLNEFVGKLVVNRQALSTMPSTTLSEDFFKGLNPYGQFHGVKKLPLQQHMKETGFASDVFHLEGDKPLANLVDFYGSDDVIIFKSGNSSQVALNRFTSGNKFFEKAFTVIQKLISDGLMEHYSIFASGNVFSMRAGKVTLWPSSEKISLEFDRKEKMGDVSVIVAKHSNGLIEIPVYCIQ